MVKNRIIKSKVIFAKTRHSYSPKVSIPLRFLYDMGITPEDREIQITYKHGYISIKKFEKE